VPSCREREVKGEGRNKNRRDDSRIFEIEKRRFARGGGGTKTLERAGPNRTDLFFSDKIKKGKSQGGDRVVERTWKKGVKGRENFLQRGGGGNALLFFSSRRWGFIDMLSGCLP